MTNVLWIALGGGVGAVLRYGMNVIFNRPGAVLPWGTLLVNLVGSFAIGLLATLFVEQLTMRDEHRLAITVGLLGGLTTFSTYTLEVLHLSEASPIRGMGYAVLANVGALVAAWLGIQVALRVIGRA